MISNENWVTTKDLKDMNSKIWVVYSAIGNEVGESRFLEIAGREFTFSIFL